MKKSVIKHYMAYRFYQNYKRNFPHKRRQEIINEFNLEYANNQVSVFNIIDVSLDEIIRYTNFKSDSYLQSLCLTKNYQAKAFKKKLNDTFNIVSKAFINEPLTDGLFYEFLNSMRFLYYKCIILPGFNPEIISLFYEIIILRAFLSQNHKLITEVLTQLEPFESYARPDYFMLYKLTGDHRFNLGSFEDMGQDLCVWDYINAASGEENHVLYLGEQLLDQALLLPQDTKYQRNIKKRELAVAAYWLGKYSGWDDIFLSEASKIDESKSILSKSWRPKELVDHRLIIEQFIDAQPELAHFLFNKLDPAKVTLTVLRNIIWDFLAFRTEYDFFKVLDLLKENFRQYYKEEYIIDIDIRKRALDKKRGLLDKSLLEDDKIEKKEKRKKFFAEKLASDQCPIVLMDYISFVGEGIINLSIYQEISAEELNEKLGTCDYSLYHKQEFDRWLSQHKRDIVNRTRFCAQSDPVTEKYDDIWLNMFINIKRIVQSNILSNLSEDWFKYKKLYCLINLHPKLFQPQYLYYLELLDISKISIKDIKYINKYFIECGALPIEITILAKSVKRDIRCNLLANHLSKSMLALFEKYNSELDHSELDHGVSYGVRDTPSAQRLQMV